MSDEYVSSRQKFEIIIQLVLCQHRKRNSHESKRSYHGWMDVYDLLRLFTMWMDESKFFKKKKVRRRIEKKKKI